MFSWRLSAWWQGKASNGVAARHFDDRLVVEMCETLVPLLDGIRERTSVCLERRGD